MYSTSLNINDQIYIEMVQITKKLNTNTSFLIRKILNYTIDKLDMNCHMHGLTRYQSKTNNNEWKCFRINFSESDCKKYYGTRYGYRISLSKLLLLGFLLFFDDVINKILKKINMPNTSWIPDSYTFLDIIFIKMIEEEEIIFQNKEKT